MELDEMLTSPGPMEVSTPHRQWQSTSILLSISYAPGKRTLTIDLEAVITQVK